MKVLVEMLNERILKTIHPTKDKNHKRPDLTFIANFLNITIVNDKEDLEEPIIALVDSNLLIKKSSKCKDYFSLNPEMILDTCGNSWTYNQH